MSEIRHRKGVIVEKKKEANNIIEIDADRMGKIGVDRNSRFTFDGESILFAIREGENFAGKALYLTGRFNWVLCKDSSDVLCLVPLKREKGGEQIR